MKKLVTIVSVALFSTVAIPVAMVYVGIYFALLAGRFMVEVASGE